MTEDDAAEVQVDPAEVQAGAEKRFFIDMLTRDIELIPAIIDLVDNSVDGARRVRGDGSLSEQWVNVRASGDQFIIEDNSGGMAIDVAREYAFRFGRPRGFTGVAKSVGQFGVGMKRAIFKLGDEFEVASAYRGVEPKTGSRFDLKVNVRDWEDLPSWHFRLEDDFADGIDLDDGETAGTKLTVRQLHGSVSDDFADPVVIQELKRQIRYLHQGAISRGLKIVVNDDLLVATLPSLQASASVQPIHYEWDIAANGHGPVSVKLFAGTVRPAERDGGEEPDLGEARDFQDPGDAGWYVFGNDRLLLSAERTTLTGWGSPAAGYHPQYRNFRGYVYLVADDAGALPWNTTKTAVDRDSRVWREVANEMKRALVSVQSAMNEDKDARASYRKQIREAEERSDQVPERPDLVAAMEDAPAIPLAQVSAARSMTVPPKPPKFKRSPPPAHIKRIQYEVDLSLFEAVADVLGASSGSEVGRLTFEYYVEAEVE